MPGFRSLAAERATHPTPEVMKQQRAKPGWATDVEFDVWQPESRPPRLQLVPEGLHMIPLPWRDDIRTPEVEPSQTGAQASLHLCRCCWILD